MSVQKISQILAGVGSSARGGHDWHFISSEILTPDSLAATAVSSAVATSGILDLSSQQTSGLHPSVIIRPGGGNGGGGGGSPTSGNDTLTGTSADNTISGLGGNDTISGLGGNDTLAGNAGADTVDGGDGNDILYSGEISTVGSDPFLDRGKDVDTIRGGDGSDIIFAGYGDNVDGGADGIFGDKLYISFQAATTGVHFDAHLTTQTIGGGTITGIENISWVEGSNYDDYIDVGSTSANGYSDPTQVFGMAGNDTLIAGYYTAGLDGGDGNDMLDGRNSQYLIGIEGGAGNDTIYGSTGNDHLTGGFGNDVIDGGAGSDAMWGGDGDDTYIVDDMNDVAYEETENVGIDTVLASASYTLITQIENLTLTGTAAIDGVGNDLANVLTGNESANTLSGLVGADHLSGAGGNDILQGGVGDDMLSGGDGNDLLVGGKGADILTGGAGTDTYKFQAGDGSDTLNDLAAGEIVQVAGYTSFQSITQVGSSVVVVFSTTDQLTFQNSTLSAVQAALQLNGGEEIDGSDGQDNLNGTDFADTIHAGDGSDTINGGAGDDIIYGEGGLDYIHGGDGNDVIHGGPNDDFIFPEIIFDDAGNDIVYGELGQDNFVGSPGDDHYDGGTGGSQPFEDDVITYANVGAGIIVDMRLASGQVHSSGTGDAANIGVDTLVNMEGIVGSNFDDVMNAGDTGIRLSGAGGNDSLTGGASWDNLYGGDGNDTLRAGTNNDVLVGGKGSDRLSGEGGNDEFRFSLGDGADVITDFSVGDRVEFSDYQAAQSITQVGSDVVVVLSATDKITFLNTDVVTVQSGLQFVPPTNDIIIGSSGDDVLNGFGGDDQIEGDIGADTIAGGDGDDMLFSNRSGFVDHGIERDVLTGGDGDDILSIGYGDDADGGNGTDTLRLDLEGASAGVTLDTGDLTSGVPVTIGGGTIQNIEEISELYGTNFTDYLTVTGGSDPDHILNRVYGLDGDDWIISEGGFIVGIDGGNGNDRIDVYAGGVNVYGRDGDDIFQVYGGTVAAEGGTGDDVFVSGVGADSFEGDEGNDTASYALSIAGVTVNLSTGVSSDGDLLYDVERVSGSNFADTLTGNSGANKLSGLDGNDTINGLAGADTLTGGAGNDTFLYGKGDGSDAITDFAAGDTVKVSGYAATQSITQNGANVVVVFASGDQITFQNTTVSVVQLGLHFDTQPPLSLTGTSGNDTLNGAAGNDTLSGLGGNDVLNGGAGNDTMTGGAGNDTYYVDAAGDKVNEQSRQGTDTVHSMINYTLGTNVENGVLDGSAAINLTGNSLANILTGNSGDNFLYGLGGIDTIKGGNGNDTLRGGAANDTLTGGAGADIFQFEKNGGNDKVTDFVSGTDKLDFHLLGISSADVKTSVSNGNTLVKVDVDHNGTIDFTITLTGVTHVNASDYIF